MQVFIDKFTQKMILFLNGCPKWTNPKRYTYSDRYKQRKKDYHEENYRFINRSHFLLVLLAACGGLSGTYVHDEYPDWTLTFKGNKLTSVSDDGTETMSYTLKGTELKLKDPDTGEEIICKLVKKGNKITITTSYGDDDTFTKR